MKTLCVTRISKKAFDFFTVRGYTIVFKKLEVRRG